MGIPGLSAADAILTIDAKEGKFLVLGMTGHEILGQMFEYTIELAGALDMLNKPKEVKLAKLLGTRATLAMEDARYFDGYVTRAKRGEKRGRYETYTLTLQPWLWFLTRTKNSRVFQEKNVKDIVTEVLKDYSGDSDWRLGSESESVYPKLDYCVQHNETDFNFVSRLLEEFGIYYFFEHEKGSHKLVLIDSMGKHKSRGDSSDITWANAMQSDTTITSWHVQEEARSATVALSEYDYLAPSTMVEGKKGADKPPEKLGTMEWFEHPALVVQNSVKPVTQSASSAASQRATVRMEELVSLYSSATGVTNARDLGAGMTFKLTGAPNDGDNDHYLMVNAIYRLDFADHEAIDDLKESRRREGYRCDFLAMITSAPNFRSPRLTPKPVIAGPQTAVVVGKSGNEIETDKHGRIKVQFHWDRLGKKNENSSCWVRVAQPWAGKSYGMFTLPRIGHEVVVQFLDGDPDRPIVTGSVYNNENMVAWTMPAHATVGGIKTQSSEGGSTDNANELRFEDKKDSEYVWLQGEKDFYRIVKNDAFDYIGNNENVEVVLTRKEVIGENWFMDITKDVMHNMGKDLHLNLAGDFFFTGGATYQLKLEKDLNAKLGGDLGLDVGGKTQLKSKDDIALQSTDGKVSLKAGKDPMSGGDILAEATNVKIKAGANVVIEATAGITLKVGGSLVNIGPAGVDIVGPMVKINSGGGGGSASPALTPSPVAPTEAKKEDSITPEKQSEYDKNFDDPMAGDAPAA